MTGTFDPGWGVRLSPVVRHQSGLNFAREINVPASAATPFGLTPGDNHLCGGRQRQREDNSWVIDVRAEKAVEVSSRVRLRGFVDFFNLTNSHASEIITRTTGPTFLRPVVILAPFTTRIGFRLLW